MNSRIRNTALAARNGLLAGALLLLPLSGSGQDESVEEIVEILKLEVDRLTSRAELDHGRKIYLRA